MVGSSSTQGKSSSARRLSFPRRFWGFSDRRVSNRSNPKIDVRWNAAFPANAAGAKIVLQCQPRECQFQQFGVGSNVSPLLRGFDQLRWYTPPTTVYFSRCREGERPALAQAPACCGSTQPLPRLLQRNGFRYPCISPVFNSTDTIQHESKAYL